MISGAQKLTAPVISELIEEARAAELCRDIAAMREALYPVWPDLDKDPDYAGFTAISEARLLRLSGFLLSFIGKSQNRPDYHPRAKDLLSAAVNVFGSEQALDEEAEATVMMALSYWHAGEGEESKAILEIVDRSYQGDPRSPLFLQIQLNRLLAFYYLQENQRSVDLIESIRSTAEMNSDLRLRTMFHNQAGIVLDAIGSADGSLAELNKAVECSNALGNRRFLAMNLNNIASAHRTAGRYSEALSAVDQALAIFLELNDTGWIPHVLDTKAVILLDQGEHTSALTVIDEAIENFSQGSDHMGLCDAMWTRARILLRANQTEDGLQEYARLHAIASSRIGVSATCKYSRLLVDELGLEASKKEIVRLEDLEMFDGSGQIHIFSADASVLTPFGIFDHSAIPVRPVRKPRPGMTVMYAADDGELYLRRVGFDSFSSMYFVNHEPDFPTPLEQVVLIGEVIGHRPISETDNARMEFFDFPE